MITKHKVCLAIVYTLKEKKETLNHKLLANYKSNV